MNFITHFLATWFDIILGVCLVAFFIASSYLISGYISRREEKRDMSELDKLREAIRQK